MIGFKPVRNIDSVHSEITVPLSQALEKDDDWDDTNNCPIGLHFLVETRHLFIKKARGRVDATNLFSRHFDILTSSNLRVFTAYEVTPDNIRNKKPQRYFKFSLRNAEGREILVITGCPINSFKLFHNNRYWGGTEKSKYTEDNVMMFPVDFVDDDRMDPPLRHQVVEVRVKDWNVEIGVCGCHHMIPREKMSTSQDIDGDVLLNDGTTQVGRVGWMWDSTDAIECDRKILGEVTGVKFPIHFDTRIKALLLGALFMMDRSFYGRTGKNRQTAKSANK